MFFGTFLSSLLKSETKFQRAPERFNFTKDWFSHNEWNFIKYLAHLIDTPCRILEIGCYEGRATVWMLENIATHPDATDHVHRLRRTGIFPAEHSCCSIA